MFNDLTNRKRNIAAVWREWTG